MSTPSNWAARTAFRHTRKRTIAITTRIAIATCLVAACLATPAAWAYPPLVEQAFANMGNKLDWSFMVTTETLEGRRTEQHVATGGNSEWTLLTLDGAAPTEKAQQSYQERKAKETQELRERGGNGFQTLAEPDSFTLLEETDTRAVFSFQPAPESEDAEKVMSMMRGLMTITKAGPHVESFRMVNSGKIKPAPLVRIHSLTIDMQFGPAAKEGPWVPLSNKTVIDGKMAGFKKIQQNTSIHYSDYSPAAE